MSVAVVALGIVGLISSCGTPGSDSASPYRDPGPAVSESGSAGQDGISPEGVIQFAESVHTSPFWSGVDVDRARDLTDALTLRGTAESAVGGRILNASPADPIQLEVVEGQDQFEWGPGLVQGGIALTFEVTDPGSSAYQRGDQVTVRVPLWTGQSTDAQGFADLEEQVMANAPVGAEAWMILRGSEPLYRETAPDGTVMPGSVILADSTGGPSASLSIFNHDAVRGVPLSEISQILLERIGG